MLCKRIKSVSDHLLICIQLYTTYLEAFGYLMHHVMHEISNQAKYSDGSVCTFMPFAL